MLTPDFDPKKDAEKIATGTVNAVAKRLLGGVIGDVVGNDILSIFGASTDTPDYTAYFEKIEKSIAGLKEQLNTLQAGVDKIQSEVVQLMAQMQQLQQEVLALTNLQLEGEMQAALTAFVMHSSVIQQNFTSYVNSLGGIGATDEKLRREAANELFLLFQITNVQAVAEAMTDLQAMFTPSLAASTGLPQLHLRKLASAIDSGTSNPASLTVNVRYMDACLGRLVYERCNAIAIDELSKASNTFKTFATVQLQGLLFLTAGWSGTLQAAQLIGHASALTDAMTMFAAFGDTALAGRGEYKGLNVILREKLSALGTRFLAFGANWGRFDSDDVRTLDGNPGHPFRGDWLLWDWCDHAGNYVTSSVNVAEPRLHLIAPPWLMSDDMLDKLRPYRSLDVTNMHIGTWVEFSKEVAIFWDAGAYKIPDSLDFIQPN